MNIEIIINIVSCIFTIAALVFTMYLWLLEQLSGEETRFVEGKAGYISALKGSKSKIKEYEIKFDNGSEQDTENAAVFEPVFRSRMRNAFKSDKCPG